jgi:hypothetical protein
VGPSLPLALKPHPQLRMTTQPRPLLRKAVYPAILLVLLLLAPCLRAQSGSGEVRLVVKDPNGRPMSASGTLTSEANQFRRDLTINESGFFDARELPFGLYRLSLRVPGFADYSALLKIHSAIPLTHAVVMKVEPVQTEIPVTDSATLLDPSQTGAVYHLGSENLRNYPTSAPGRGIIDLVRVQPGWLLEANGVLHPRGAEYDTQYVVDGIPLLDNRSPAFAPFLDSQELQSVNILTSDFPAEFGRKLGGVVEAVTTHATARGFHGKAALQGGSFAMAGGLASGVYQAEHSTVLFSLTGSRTDRYLDPSVPQNFTNTGSTFGASTGLDHDFSEQDRMQISLRYGHTAFQVPDELLQEQAGQRQDRGTDEVSGQISYQHIFSPDLLASVQARGRDLSADLSSNPESTPILPAQSRGFREGYLRATLSGHQGRHDWKIGADALFGSIREFFSYQLTNPQFFEPSTPAAFSFSGHKYDLEQSAFAQDLMRFGQFTLSAGLRWDHYHLVVDENAFSPRLGAAYYFPSAGLVLRASYDRIFQTPASENLLLASSPQALTLNQQSAFLPVRPARGNYYEAGFAKSVFGKASWNLDYFHRDLENFSDDDLLLNTGISFPIAFHRGVVYGFESKLEIPHWGPFSGFLSYSYLLGRAQLPVAGGLFLGDDTSQLNSTIRIPISQDQRSTASARILYQVNKRFWTAVGASYGSGLPTELNGNVDFATLEEQYGPNVVGKVNLVRGRARPSSALDASAGWDVWQREKRSLRFQADAFNLGDRLNVINFAGLFSGTAIAPGRTFAIRLEATF